MLNDSASSQVVQQQPHAASQSVAAETCFWITDLQAAELWQCPARTARHRLKNCQKMKDRSGKGRPRNLYYVGSHPELSALLSQLALPPSAPVREPTRSTKRVLEADDLAVAALRLRAVNEYLHLKDLYNEERAATTIVAEWTAHPREREVQITQRISGSKGHERKLTKTVSVGGFSLTTLREWARAALDAGDTNEFRLEALAPSRKGNTGRTERAIPEGLINLVYALATATPRADLVKGLREARANWPHEWPDVSYRTWLRRMRQKDPERFCATLGKSGIAAFRKDHSPDIERDYSNMAFNEEWQLDDVREDFYAHGSDPRRVIRPYAYAIIRVSTRQWICAVTAETPITQDQVRAMIGFALASKGGGIPARIRFERGTVACGPELEESLSILGISVARTSMDGGRVHPGAMPDRASGHFQGKGIVESNIRGHHGRNAYQALQVGTDERLTMSSRGETLKAEAEKAAKAGTFLMLPTVSEWQAAIFQALESHNNEPHTGLRKIIDPVDGTPRHMTPNETAQLMKDQDIRLMDERLLPAFFQKGVECDVTKNGFRINDVSYGRLDQDLAALAGTKVTAYALKEMPDAAYVVELGRCVARFDKPDAGEEGDLLHQKRAIEQRKRNQYEQLIAEAQKSAGTEIADALRFTSNPTPSRRFDLLCPKPLLDRAAAIQRGQQAHQDKKTASAKRFDLDAGARSARDVSSPSPRRRSLLKQADELRGQVAAYVTAPKEDTTEDKFRL